MFFPSSMTEDWISLGCWQNTTFEDVSSDFETHGWTLLERTQLIDYWQTIQQLKWLLVSALVSIIKHEMGIWFTAENMTWNELIAYDRSFGETPLCWSESSLTDTHFKQHSWKTGRVLFIDLYFLNNLINDHLEHKMSKLRSKICFIWESKMNKKHFNK